MTLEEERREDEDEDEYEVEQLFHARSVALSGALLGPVGQEWDALWVQWCELPQSERVRVMAYVWGKMLAQTGRVCFLNQVRTGLEFNAELKRRFGG